MDHHRYQHRNRQFVTGIVLSIAGFAVSVNALPPLVTGLAETYGVAPALFGIVFFCQLASFAVFSSVSGFILGKGRGDPEIILICALLFAGLSVGFIGVIPSFFALVVFMVVIGGCGGIVESTGTMMLTQCGPDTNGRYVHISQMFYCLGALFAPMVIGILLAASISIPLIGGAVGLLTVVIAVIVMLCVVRSRQSGYDCSPVSVDGQTGSEKHNLLERPTWGAFVWFLLVMILYVMLEISVASWLPTYLVKTFRTTAATASFHLMLFWTGLAAARFIYIFLDSGAIRKQLGVHIFSISVCTAFLFLGPSSVTARGLIIFLLGVSCGPVWPLIVNLYSQLYASRHHVMYIVSAGSVGGVTGIVVTSWAVKVYGAHSMMTVLILYAVVLLLAYLAMMRVSRRRRI
ncbi:MAG: MFS transporter [Candidatus Pacebacteria bacterium]|nr:MFS transporter [Candidatus Paceibacterota bacterium]